MNKFVLSEQDEAGASGPRAMKEPGDPVWCWQTISHLQSLWQSLNLDFDMYMTTWAEADVHRVWENVPYDNPFGTKENMLRQLEIGDDQAAEKRVACQAIAARAMRHKSRPFKADERSHQGNIIARIARERPDILDRMIQKEFQTVSEAVKAAGIGFTKRKKTVTLSDNVDRVADTLKDHYTEEQIRRIMQRLGESQTG